MISTHLGATLYAVLVRTWQRASMQLSAYNGARQAPGTRQAGTRQALGRQLVHTGQVINQR